MYPKETFLCSFDIRNSFSNVPLAETIEICVDAMYGRWHIPLGYPKEIFVELKDTATKSVKFSVNNNMYKQIDGVATGNPLNAALVNIFVGYHESKLFESTKKPFLYHRYVFDTFCHFWVRGWMQFFSWSPKFNAFGIKVHIWKRREWSAPAFRCFVKKSNEGFLTSVFSNPLLLDSSLGFVLAYKT